jgi:hypothetical protein
VGSTPPCYYDDLVYTTESYKSCKIKPSCTPKPSCQTVVLRTCFGVPCHHYQLDRNKEIVYRPLGYDKGPACVLIPISEERRHYCN